MPMRRGLRKNTIGPLEMSVVGRSKKNDHLEVLFLFSVLSGRAKDLKPHRNIVHIVVQREEQFFWSSTLVLFFSARAAGDIKKRYVNYCGLCG
jgi:hypothetical protein